MLFIIRLHYCFLFKECEEKNILPTTLAALSIATFLLGVMLIVVSKLRLASLIQYIPMPVIGGYLGELVSQR